MVKLEVGKFYRQRNGGKVGPLRIKKIYCEGVLTDGKLAWWDDGSYFKGEENELDLIAEWTDTPAEVIGENVRVIPINEVPDEVFERIAETRSKLYEVIGVDAQSFNAETMPEAYSEIIEKVNIAEAAFNSMIDQAEEDGRKVFTSEMERAIKSAEISPNEYDRAPNHVESTTRARILDTAKEYVTKDRQATHGAPEDTFGLIAAYWSAHLDKQITAVDVVAMMALLKLARAKANPSNDDNWIDLAGYAACAGELAE